MRLRIPSFFAAMTLAATLLGVGVPSQQAAAVVDPPCTVDAMLVNSCRPWFGSTSNGYAEAPADTKEQLLYFEQRVGRQVDMAHTYHGAGNASHTLNATDLYFANRPDTLLYLNWPLTNTFSTASGANATVNGYIDQMARSIQSLGGKKIMLALHHEPENDIAFTCPGQSTKPGTMGSAAEYVAMWRNVRARFDALGVDNVIWVMNYMNYPAYDCMLDDVWPGNEYVDYVSFNGYQTSDRDVSFVNRVGRFYNLLLESSTPEHDYASKEWGLVEWGLHNTTQASTYLYYQQAKKAVEDKVFPRLRFYMVFDNGDRNRNIFDFQVAYDGDGVLDPREQAEFNLFANSWALTGDGLPDEQPPPSDTTAPSTPTNVSAAVSSGRPVVTWSASSDDVAVTGYDVLRDGAVVGTTTAGLSYTDTSALQGRTYSYSVRARDAAGNTSAASTAAAVAVPDTTAPSAPASLRAARTTSTRVTLTWTAATDNVAVTSYLVYRGATLVGTVGAATRSFSATGLAPGTTYAFSVRARDAAGNLGVARTARG